MSVIIALASLVLICRTLRRTLLRANVHARSKKKSSHAQAIVKAIAPKYNSKDREWDRERV